MKTIIIICLMVVSVSWCYSQTNITKAEYFIDSDLGVGLNTIVNVSAGNDITEAILTSMSPSISVGIHKLYFRTKDANNKWSQTTRKNIEIVKPQIQNNVLIGEYFLNADPTYASGISFEINSKSIDVIQDFLAQIPSNTPIGYYKLYGRVKDSYGNWGLTFRKNIQVVEYANQNIIAIEYFFGSDLQFGKNSSVVINTPETEGTWNFYVPYPAGTYNFNDKLFVRTKDSKLKWSHTTLLDAIDTGLSTVDLATNVSVKIFPNPVKDVLTISATNQFNISNISIYDISGKNVFTSVKNNRSINLSHLNSGMYILNIKTDLGTANFKLIKQ